MANTEPWCRRAGGRSSSTWFLFLWHSTVGVGSWRWDRVWHSTPSTPLLPNLVWGLLLCCFLWQVHSGIIKMQTESATHLFFQGKGWKDRHLPAAVDQTRSYPVGRCSDNVRCAQHRALHRREEISPPVNAVLQSQQYIALGVSLC